MKRIIAGIVIACALVGCKMEASVYADVTIVNIIPEKIVQNDKGKVAAYRDAYTVVEVVTSDESTGIRYKVPGDLGEIGDVFSLDIANAREI